MNAASALFWIAAALLAAAAIGALLTPLMRTGSDRHTQRLGWILAVVLPLLAVVLYLLLGNPELIER